MKRTIIAMLMFVSCASSASVYRCQEDGKTTFSDRPCGITSEKIEIKGAANGSSRNAGTWEFIRQRDELRNELICVAKSPNFYLGAWGSDFLFASLRISGSEQQPLVILNSESPLSERAKSFHNDISGLGIKIGEFPFIHVDKSINSYILSFSLADGKNIVEQLRASSSFQARLRFWPYPDTYDGNQVDVRGMQAAVSQAFSCEN